MSKCLKCGKRGLLLRVNLYGICQECIEREEREKREKAEKIAYEKERRRAEELSAFRKCYFPIEIASSSLSSEWSFWDTKLHNDEEQLIRQKRAIYQTIPICVNSKVNSGYFVSSFWNRVYNTDLISCDCDDFQKRNKPCKHIYRLFWELNHNHCVNVPEILNPDMSVLNAFFSLNDEQRVEFLNKARYASIDSYQTVRSPFIESAITTGLYSSTESVDYAVVLNKKTKDELILALAKKDIRGFKPSWSKVKLIDWLCESQQLFLKTQYPNLVVVTYTKDVLPWVDGIRKSAQLYNIVLPDTTTNF